MPRKPVCVSAYDYAVIFDNDNDSAKATLRLALQAVKGVGTWNSTG